MERSVQEATVIVVGAPHCCSLLRLTHANNFKRQWVVLTFNPTLKFKVAVDQKYPLITFSYSFRMC